jgi:hypothetical protein
MNMINSVILEGVVFGQVWYAENYATVTVDSYRYEKVGDKCSEIITPVKVILRDGFIDRAKLLEEGRHVRVVGRLCINPYDGKVAIHCECLEMKPMIKVGNRNFVK